MTQNKVTIPIAKILMKDGEEIIISRDRGIRLQEALEKATQHLFVNLTEHGRTINTAEMKELDVNAVDTKFEDIDDKVLEEEENERIRNITPKERSKMLGRFRLSWMREMRKDLGFIPSIVPDDTMQEAEKVQLKYYTENPNEVFVPDEVYRKAGLFEAIK